jgi:putative acetyltransferase
MTDSRLAKSVVRDEQPHDATAIRAVNEQAFGQAGEADLVDALRARGAVTLSLVAVVEDEIIGHILFTPAPIVDAAGAATAAVALGPMAVHPAHQRRGIGSRLVEVGLERLRAAGHQLVVVLGHPTYYPRFGFVPASRLAIGCTWDVPDDVFMALELGAGAARGFSGTAHYQPEFMTVD